MYMQYTVGLHSMKNLTCYKTRTMTATTEGVLKLLCFLVVPCVLALVRSASAGDEWSTSCAPIDGRCPPLFVPGAYPLLYLAIALYRRWRSCRRQSSAALSFEAAGDDAYVYIEHVVEVDPQVEEEPALEGECWRHHLGK